MKTYFYFSPFQGQNQKMFANFPGLLVWILIPLSGLLFSSCRFDAPMKKEVQIPKYQFDYPLTFEDISQAGCYPGILEEKLAGIGYLEQRLLKRLAGELMPAELEKQSFRWHSEILREYEILKEDERATMLLSILERMVKVIDGYGLEHPNFKMYLVQPKMNASIANAWTTGSYIYLTTDMLEFCQNDVTEIAAIIAHEICHTAVHHHTSHFTQRQKLAEEYLGESWGRIVANLYEKILSNSLGGQFDEYEADLSSLVLLYESGYDPAKALRLYKRMADESENENSFLRIMKSHPIGEQRLACMAAAVERARINGTESGAKHFLVNNQY